MQVSVKKWGNSASVRIPAAILEATRLQVDDTVEIREEAGRIVIEPLRREAYDLEQLLAGITADNVHGEADFGPAVGKEAF
jgi:antitoxin MazE